MTEHSTKREVELRGIKCDLPLKFKQSDSWSVEKRLQSKRKLSDLVECRNGLSLHSAGDKPNRSPNYSVDFYKAPGLIPGSTNKQHKRNAARKKQIDFTIDNNAPWPMKPFVTWDQKLALEELQENIKQLSDVDIWEETVLKEHYKASQTTTIRFGALANTANSKNQKK